jgi:hypothetical protein
MPVFALLKTYDYDQNGDATVMCSLGLEYGINWRLKNFSIANEN